MTKLLSTIVIVSTLAISSSASAQAFGGPGGATGQCGPTLGFTANVDEGFNTHANAVDGFRTDADGNLNYNDATTDDIRNNAGVKFGLTLNFNLDGGRGCKLVDLQIANQKDMQARAARQAYLQEQAQAANQINGLLQAIQYCETADITIPANAEFCSEYLSK